MQRATRIRAAVAVGLAVLGTAAVQAEDWMQWRGPNRDGHVVGFDLKTWPKQFDRLWNVEVGEGHAGPVVAGRSVFVFSREGEREKVRALRLFDGSTLWSQDYAAPFQMSPYAMTHGKGPKSTPLLAGDRLYTLGISNILTCWDTKTGKQLWQQDFAKKYSKQSSLWYGAAASPALEGDLLIAAVGVRDQGALVGLDSRSGQVRWQWEGDGAAYASPIVATFDGVRQVVTQSQKANIGLSAADGSLLWSMPFVTEYDQNIITPVVVGDRVIFAGLGQPTTAYQIRKADGKWSPTQVWENRDVRLYMSSPVLVGDRLVGLAQRKKGQFFCLDAATGKTLWTSEGRAGEYAVILAVGKLLIAQTTDGELIVFDPAANQFQPIASYKVADKPTWAQPALGGNWILVKDRDSLTLWAPPLTGRSSAQ